MTAAEQSEGLPGVLARISEAAGPEVALEMASKFGGRTVYIPARPVADSVLVRAVGQAAVEKIIRAIGRGHLEVPLGPLANYARMRAAIRAQLRAGKSAPQIARMLGCHERTVERERRRMR